MMNAKKKHLAILISTILSAQTVYALPQGAQVIQGTASISSPNSSTLNITNSNNAIINWQQFNIGAGQTTNFIQPSSSSSVLNRVIGQNPSQLLGNLNSNGQVYLINQHGILVGEGARINTNGFFASTLNITNEAFLNGDLTFSGGGLGSINNKGYIHAGADGNVVLVAPNIENGGVIEVENGNIILAAGKSITITSLDNAHVEFNVQSSADSVTNLGSIIARNGAANLFAGTLKHSGLIKATRITRDQNGVIRLVASDTVSVNGSLDVSGEEGGDIHILADTITIESDANIDASGTAQGGEILIGGDQQGLNPNIQNATSTTIEAGATVTANATQTGDGGRVIVFAKNDVHVHSEITAKGGQVSGNGGFIETSGLKQLDITVAPNASASNGDAGEWLIDPENIEIIDAANESAITGNPDFTSVASGAQLATETIETALNAGTSVTVTTSANGMEYGDITITNDILKSAGADAALTLTAHNNINVNADIASTSGILDLNLNPNSDDVNGGEVQFLSAGTDLTIDLNGGSLVIDGNSNFIADPFNQETVDFKNLDWLNNDTIQMSGYGSIFFSDASLTNAAAGTIVINNSRKIGVGVSDTGGASLVNNGLIAVTNAGVGYGGSSEGLLIDINVINNGVINVNDAEAGDRSKVEIAKDFTNSSTGIINYFDGGSIQSEGGSTTSGIIVSGGTFINQGQVNFNGFFSDARNSQFVINGGTTVNNSGALNVTGTLGTLNTGAGSGFVIDEASVFNNLAGGQVSVAVSDASDGSIFFGLLLNGSSTFNNQSGASVKLSGVSGIEMSVVGSFGVGGNSTFNHQSGADVEISDFGVLSIADGTFNALGGSFNRIGTNIAPFVLGDVIIGAKGTFNANVPTLFSSDLTLALENGVINSFNNIRLPNTFNIKGGTINLVDDIFGIYDDAAINISGSDVLTISGAGHSFLHTSDINWNATGANGDIVLDNVRFALLGDLNINNSSSSLAEINGSGSLELISGARITQNSSELTRITVPVLVNGELELFNPAGSLEFTSNNAYGGLGLARGATLSGEGTYIGNVNVQAGGIVSPGVNNGIGTLNVTGDVAFNSGSNLLIDISTMATDVFSVSGGVSIVDSDIYFFWDGVTESNPIAVAQSNFILGAEVSLGTVTLHDLLTVSDSSVNALANSVEFTAGTQSGNIRFWTGNSEVSNNWNDAANWDGGVVPATGDIVVLETNNVDIDAPTNFIGLAQIDANISITGFGVLNSNADLFTLGDVEINSATAGLGGTGDWNVFGYAAVNVAGNTLTKNINNYTTFDFVDFTGLATNYSVSGDFVNHGNTLFFANSSSNEIDFSASTNGLTNNGNVNFLANDTEIRFSGALNNLGAIRVASTGNTTTSELLFQSNSNSSGTIILDGTNISLANGVNYTLESGSTITGSGAFNIGNGSTLIINDNFIFETGQTLNLDGGTLQLQNTVIINDTFNWLAGVVEGTLNGQLTTGSLSTTTLASSTTDNDVELRGLQWFNQGNVSFVSNGGDFLINNSAVFNNAGIFNINNSAASSDIVSDNSVETPFVNTSSGTINVNATTGIDLFTNFDNQGTVVINSELAINNIAQSSGAIVLVNSGATLKVDDTANSQLTLSSTGSVLGYGSLIVEDGATLILEGTNIAEESILSSEEDFAVELRGISNVSTGVAFLMRGTSNVILSQDITFSDNFTWEGGTISGATFTTNGNTTLGSGFDTVLNANWINSGNVNWISSGGKLVVNGQLTNDGTFNVETKDGSVLTTGTGQFVNNGVFQFNEVDTSGVASAKTLTLRSSFINNGTVDLANTNYVVNIEGLFVNSGNVNFTKATEVNINTNGKLSVLEASTFNGTESRLSLNGGEINLSADFLAPILFNWNSGLITASLTEGQPLHDFVIAQGSTLNVFSQGTHTLNNVTMSIAGTLNLPSNSGTLADENRLTVEGGGNNSINILSTATINSDGVEGGAIFVKKGASINIDDGVDYNAKLFVAGTANFKGAATVDTLALDSNQNGIINLDTQGLSSAGDTLTVGDLFLITGSINGGSNSENAKLITTGTSVLTSGSLIDAEWVNRGTLNWIGDTTESLTLTRGQLTNASTGVINVRDELEAENNAANSIKTIIADGSGVLLNDGVINLRNADLNLGSLILELNQSTSQLNGDGVITGSVVNAAGSISIGNPRDIFNSGAITINGDYSQGPNGSLTVRIVDPIDSKLTFDTFTVTGLSKLAGNLNLSYFTNQVSSVTENFSPIILAQREGIFDRLIDTNGTILSVDYIDGGLTILGASAAEQNVEITGIVGAQEDLGNILEAIGGDELDSGAAAVKGILKEKAKKSDEEGGDEEGGDEEDEDEKDDDKEEESKKACT